MVKLGDTNPAHLLVKRRLQKLDTEALEAEHTHICGGSDMDHMTKAQRLQLILDKLETIGTFKHQQEEWTLQELMSLKRMPRTTLDGNHHNRQL